jgi:GntP family gluconate:H+ symporter
VLVAIPTVIIAGPLFAKLAARWVDVPAPHLFDTDAPNVRERTQDRERDRDGNGDGTP